MENNETNNEHNCSFCGKNRLSVKKLIVGPNAFICDECVLISSEMLKKEKKDDFLSNEIALLSPKKIKEEFDKYVIGQDDAKKALSVVVNNHYKRLLLNSNDEDLKDGKTNLLMIGPTSSGKTLLIRVLQKMMHKNNIPVAFADATTLTEAGYVGDDVESILLRLLQEADYNVAKAQKGIIFIDEIDKIAMKGGNASMSRDVSGEGVQQALLGMLQGKTAMISPNGRKNAPGQESIAIDTSDILFICAGAFSGLEKIIEARCDSSSVGFHGTIKKKNTIRSYKTVEVDDLTNYGMIPEFLGRLPVVVTLDDLDEEGLVEVLTKPKNAIIEGYKSLFKMNNASLTITDDALHEIAKIAIKKKVSARGLKLVIENILQDTMFFLEDYLPCEVVLDKEAVINKKPKIVKLN